MGQWVDRNIINLATLQFLQITGGSGGVTRVGMTIIRHGHSHVRLCPVCLHPWHRHNTTTDVAMQRCLNIARCTWSWKRARAGTVFIRTFVFSVNNHTPAWSLEYPTFDFKSDTGLNLGFSVIRCTKESADSPDFRMRCVLLLSHTPSKAVMVML